MQKSLTLAAAIALAAVAAHAQIAIGDLISNDTGLGLNVQFVLSGFTDPSTVCGTNVVCQESESNLYLHLDAAGIATATCTPPGGGGSGKRQVALPTPIPVASAGAIGGQNFTPPGPPSWGVSMGAGPPTSLTVAGAPDCPNLKWSEMITDLAFTTATISVQQGQSPIATGQVTCTFNPPTANGSVPKNSYASADCIPAPSLQ
jgi:hypothetical protein